MIHIKATLLSQSNFALFHEERIQRSQIWRARGPENRPPSSYPKIRIYPIQKGTKTTGEMG
jgi:hypothetical protein